MQVVDDLGQALARGNALPYGLAGHDFTPCAASDRHMLEELAVGVIGINPMMVKILETCFDSGWSLSAGDPEGSIYGLRSRRQKYVGNLEI
ncbi:hypothetical protein NKH82_33285 [Mesorhizobium sp. M0915]